MVKIKPDNIANAVEIPGMKPHIHERPTNTIAADSKDAHTFSKISKEISIT